jgi:hypothetical protein
MIMAENIQIVIMTVDRSPQYVHTALASLFASGPSIHRVPQITLMVGQVDCNYLAPYGHHRQIQVEPLTALQSQSMAGWRPQQKFCLNYYRCLSLAIGDASGLVVCEDDIVVRDRFLDKLLAAINEIESEHGLRKYLLAAYAAYRLDDDPALRRGKFFSSYYAPSFYGTQCMYYPRSVLPALSQRLYEQGVTNYTQPGDMIVKAFGHEINGIYGTVRSLAQHIGHRSTGLGNFHTSPTFDEEFPPLTPA